MSFNPLLRRFQEAHTSSLSKEQLLLLLVDGALQRAEMAADAQDPEERRTALSKLRRIVTELITSLNVDMGGQTAVGLLRAYAVLSRHVVRAEMNDDPEALAEVVKRVRTLHELWHTTVALASGQEEGAGEREAA